MSRRFKVLGLSAAIAVSALGVSTQYSAAQVQGAAVVARSAASVAWPAWIVGGGIVSVMARAAVVHHTLCRELTINEAIGGMSPFWPIYQRRDDRCHQQRGACRTQQAEAPGQTVTRATPSTRRRAAKCGDGGGFPPVAGALVVKY